MLRRRDFLKRSAAFGALGLVKPMRALGSRYQTTTGYFGVHPFVDKHPEAVFIMNTDVDVKTNSEAKKNTGLMFARSVFLPMKGGGIPLSYKIPIKPNLTCSHTSDKTFTLEFGMGIVTDPYFIEGIIEGMKELGFSGNQFYLREVNCPEDFGPRGYYDMAERTGADMRDLHVDVSELGKEFVQWRDVPDGVVHQKIPYLWPVNAPETFYLNIAKYKSHGTGMTLCCKNHQGSVAHQYQQFCTGRRQLNEYPFKYLYPDAEEKCQSLYEQHLRAGFTLWERLVKPGRDNNLWLDVWCQRTLDNLSASSIGLNIIEGIYGREGCFLRGPNPPLHNDKGIKEARDYMTNIVIFGKDPVLVDIIGHWLAGHEPGNFGFFHIAMERGLSTIVDPHKIPVYLWNDGAAALTTLELFPRTPILSDYIPKDGYHGDRDAKYYMYDEPFDYSKIDEKIITASYTTGTRLLEKCRPNPVNPYIAVEYTLSESDYARLDILNENGERLETIVNGYCQKGAHCAVWNIRNHSSGTYYSLFRTGDFKETKKIKLE